SSREKTLFPFYDGWPAPGKLGEGFPPCGSCAVFRLCRTGRAEKLGNAEGPFGRANRRRRPTVAGAADPESVALRRLAGLEELVVLLHRLVEGFQFLLQALQP